MLNKQRFWSVLAVLLLPALMSCSTEVEESQDMRGKTLSAASAELDKIAKGPEVGSAKTGAEEGVQAQASKAQDVLDKIATAQDALAKTKFPENAPGGFGVKRLSQLAVFSGSVLKLEGFGFKEGMVVRWNTPGLKPTALEIAPDGRSASLKIPSLLPRGLVEALVTTANKMAPYASLAAGSVLGLLEGTSYGAGGAIGGEMPLALRLSGPVGVPEDRGQTLAADELLMIKFLHLGEESNYPVFSGSPDVMCRGQIFVNLKGETLEGTKDCTQTAGPQTCSRDGDENCLIGTGFRAAAVEKLVPEKIRSGHRIAGVAGLEPVCMRDGARDCFVSSDTVYAAARLDGFTDKDIKQGVTIAGVVGKLELPVIPPPPPLCQEEGAEQCLVGGAFTSAAKARLRSENIRIGVTLGGVLGTLIPTPVDCLNITDTACVVTDRFRLVTPQSLKAEDIRQGVRIGQTLGTLVPAPSDCQSDAQKNCVVKDTFMALKTSSLAPSLIRRGVSIAGVTGVYPSASFPLETSTSVPDLTRATFDAQVKSADEFEWFDPAGNRHVYRGDEDIEAIWIKNGVSIFGTSGLLEGGLPCQVDGEKGCVAAGRFAAADVQNISGWDIRLGRQIGGIAGELVFYKNMAKTDLYDRMVAPHSQEGIDLYDTTDDHANVGTFPTESPPGFVRATGANWIREESTDDGRGGGTAGNGQCDGNEVCLYKDRLTGLTWAQGDGVQRSYDVAITHCEALNRGGMNDFRLPTQKELLQAYVNGIWSLKDPSKLNIMAFNWSSSTVSYAFDSGWLIYLNYGYSAATVKTSKAASLCVRGF